MKDKPILLFQRIVPSYRVAMFRYLYQELGIVVCHSKPRKNGKINAAHEQMDYPNEMISRCYYQKDETAVVQNVLKPLFKDKPKVIIAPFSVKYITTWLLFVLKPIFGYKLILWSHGIKSKEVDKPFQTMRGKISRWAYQKADAIILYSDSIKKIFDLHIATPAFVAKNTLNTNGFKHFYNNLKVQGVEKIKKDLSFHHKYNLIFVGRLLPSKRLDILIEAFNILSKKYQVALHIIGDGEEMPYVLGKSKINNDIKIHGSIYDDSITAKYLFASDLMIMPGYVGLSIIHAFAFGLPMVTSRTTAAGPFHAPEIEYLIEGENGVLCNMTKESYAETIGELLEDKKKLNGMQKNALHTAYNDASVENFVNGFHEAVQFVSKK